VSLPRLVPALVVLALLAACGEETGEPSPSTPAPRAVERPIAVPAAQGKVTTGHPVTVLDDGDGAELCLGGVMDSLPPQCGGPSLVGWEWADHQGEFESANGVRWGDFVVTGTFDGTSVTPSDVVPADEFEEQDDSAEFDGDSFATPCPEPDGGWRVLDPALTTEESLQTTMMRAEQLDGYSESWLDQSINPAWDDGQIDAGDEELLNDPALLVINVRVTHDPEGAEAELRKVWGGSLCVSTAQHTDKELRGIQEEVNDLPGMLGSAPDDDRVELMVTYDDGSYQAWADATYGEGTVLVYSALRTED
jgi:hypothetical protein